MKVLSFVLASALSLAPAAALAGEAERDSQSFGNRPNQPQEAPANVPDAAVIGGGIVLLALIGGAAAGLGSGGSDSPPTTTGTQ